MDLKGIDAWTREALEQEARRRGIVDAELRPRRELIRLIVQSSYSRAMSQGVRRIARGFKSIDQARDMLSIALETAADLRARLPLPGRTGRTLVGMPTPVTVAWRDDAAASPTAPDAHAADASDAHPSPAAPDAHAANAHAADAHPSPTAPDAHPSPAAPDAHAANAHAADAHPSPAAPATDAGPAVGARLDVPASPSASPPAPAHPPAAFAAPHHVAELVSAARELTRGPTVAERVGGRAPAAAREPTAAREPGTNSFVDEPIRTHSMARLLAAQGHVQRAIAIYEELLAQNSEAPELRDELAALRRGELPAQPETRLPEPPAVKLPDTGDRLNCERAGDDGLELSWSVSDAGRARARAVLGHDGELTVRLVRICPDAERVVRSEITEHGPVQASGRWYAAGAVAGERWVAAVGLRTGSRFVSIAHARA